MKNAWKKIKEDLSKTVSTSAFNLWLSQLEACIEDNTLVVICPTKYVATRINSKYKSTITEIASTFFKTTFNVRIEVSTDSSIKKEKIFEDTQKPSTKISSEKQLFPIKRTRPLLKRQESTSQIVQSTIEKDYVAKNEKSEPIPPVEAPLPLPLTLTRRIVEENIPSSKTLSQDTTVNDSSNLVKNTIHELQNLQNLSNNHRENNTQEPQIIHSSCGMDIPTDTHSTHTKKQTQLTLDLHIKRAPKKFQYSFNNFVVGDCNSLAFASSQALCDTTNSLASTLYLSSPPGLGKTHLLQSLGQELIKVSNLKNVHIEYLSAEDFTSQFTLAMQRKELGEFLGKLKSADVFLLEDVHFLQGKEKIQAQLLSIIKSLQAQGSRIAVSSSFSLKEVRQMDEQLSSCFQEGYVANINIPDFSIRKKIVENKAKYYNVFLPDTVADILAESICSDIRQIEGCLKTIILKARSMKQEISPSMAMEILSAYDVSEKKITFDDIVSTVCKYFGLSLERLTSKTRQKECVLARNLIFYLARANTEMTLKEVAQFFNRQHSTVIKGITNVELEMVRATPKAQQMISVVNLIDPHKAIHA